MLSSSELAAFQNRPARVVDVGKGTADVSVDGTRLRLTPLQIRQKNGCEKGSSFLESEYISGCECEEQWVPAKGSNVTICANNMQGEDFKVFQGKTAQVVSNGPKWDLRYEVAPEGSSFLGGKDVSLALLSSQMKLTKCGSSNKPPKARNSEQSSFKELAKRELEATKKQLEDTKAQLEVLLGENDYNTKMYGTPSQSLQEVSVPERTPTDTNIAVDVHQLVSADRPLPGTIEEIAHRDCYSPAACN